MDSENFTRSAHTAVKGGGKLNLTKSAVERALKDMAVEQAVYIEWEVGDRLLDFVDGSRLGITAPGANTMAGSSRVMAPGESGLRTSVRGNRPHLNGVTRTSWYWTKTGKSYGKPEAGEGLGAAAEVQAPPGGIDAENAGRRRQPPTDRRQL